MTKYTSKKQKKLYTKKGDIYENNSRSIRKTRSFNKRRL